MLIAGFPTSPWRANCYVLATQPGAECVIIDPGPGAAGLLPRVLGGHDLTAAGVVLTHGHIDHVGDAAEVAARYRVPCWLHPADRALLSDPAAGLDAASAAFVAELLGGRPLSEPDDVRDIVAGQAWEVAGLEFQAVDAPGHTPGSVLALVAGHCFSGDVVFAGSIGRMDLPGGSEEAMTESLRRFVALPREMPVHPGHGPATTVGDAIRGNPYLAAFRGGRPSARMRERAPRAATA